MLDHLKIPGSQRVILLKQGGLEKMLETERIFFNKPIYNVSIEKKFWALTPDLFPQELKNHIYYDFVIIPVSAALTDL